MSRVREIGQLVPPFEVESPVGEGLGPWFRAGYYHTGEKGFIGSGEGALAVPINQPTEEIAAKLLYPTAQRPNFNYVRNVLGLRPIDLVNIVVMNLPENGLITVIVPTSKGNKNQPFTCTKFIVTI